MTEEENSVNTGETRTMQNLIQDAGRGNEAAFQEIFEKTTDRVFSYALSRVHDRDLASDITQETFIDLWNALKNFQYKSDEAFLGFVFIILKRKIYKSYKTKDMLTLEENMINESYEMDPEDYRFLLKYIGVLKERDQEVLRLRYWSDMTFKQIASVLGITETNAKVLHHRAVKKLQILLEKYEHEI